MPRRADISSEWARIGSRVAAALPEPVVRRLLAALDHLAHAAPGDAVEAVAAMDEIACDGRADLTQDERLALLEQRAMEAQQAHAVSVTADSRVRRMIRNPSR